MFKEHERIILTEDIPKDGLAAGDVGTIVHIHRDGVAFQVEFFSTDGTTLTIATVEATQARLPMRYEILHARTFDPKFEL